MRRGGVMGERFRQGNWKDFDQRRRAVIYGKRSKKPIGKGEEGVYGLRSRGKLWAKEMENRMGKQ